MPRKRRPVQVQVDELRKVVRSLSARVAELEELPARELTAVIGFEVEQPAEDFDEDQPEYRKKFDRPGR